MSESEPVLLLHFIGDDGFVKNFSQTKKQNQQYVDMY